MTSVVFEVEQVGCPSCAARVRGALERLGAASDVAIDEEADEATVRLRAEPAVGEDDVKGRCTRPPPGAGTGTT